MAGDSNTGGGGSVYWKVDATEVDEGDIENDHERPGRRGNHHQSGKDNSAAYGSFTITIKVPDIFPTGQAFVAALTQLITIDGRHIRFNLPIEDDKRQIRIEWR